MITDKFFRRAALAVAEAQSGGQAATYFYESGWGRPGDSLRFRQSGDATKPSGRNELDDSRPVRFIRADGCSIEHDARGDERAVWLAR